MNFVVIAGVSSIVLLGIVLLITGYALKYPGRGLFYIVTVVCIVNAASAALLALYLWPDAAAIIYGTVAVIAALIGVAAIRKRVK